MKRTKLELGKLKNKVTLCWIPSHCGTTGNENSDWMADTGSKMNEQDAPVTQSIIRAKLRNRKWEIKHPRAKATYKDRRGPDKTEKLWNEEVRRLFGQLCSGHSEERGWWKHFIGIRDFPICRRCSLQEDETIKHVLCRCEFLEARRIILGCTGITVDWMTGPQTETFRKLLEARFDDLKIPKPQEKGRK